MNEILKEVLGNQSLAGFSGNLILAVIGIFLKLMMHANTRNAASPNTPTDFSVGFLLKDNALRLFSSFAFSLFVVFVAIRFTSELLHVELNPFIAVMIGFCSDLIAEKLKDASKSIPSFQNTDTTLDDEAIDPSKAATDQLDVGDTAEVKTGVVKE